MGKYLHSYITTESFEKNKMTLIKPYVAYIDDVDGVVYEKKVIHEVEVYTNEACTIRPIIGESYQKLYVQLNVDLPNGGVYYGSNYESHNDDSITFSVPNPDNFSEPSSICLAVDFNSNCNYDTYQKGLYEVYGNDMNWQEYYTYSFGEIVSTECKEKADIIHKAIFNPINTSIDSDGNYRSFEVKLIGDYNGEDYTDNDYIYTSFNVTCSATKNKVFINYGEYTGEGYQYETITITCKMPEPRFSKIPEDKILYKI